MGRFSSPSSILSLKYLIGETGKRLALALLLALSAHIGAFWIRIQEEGEKAAKPLTTKFVKREPRLAKPLEFRKLPKPKQRPMRRKPIPVRIKAARRDLSAPSQPLKVLDSLVKPRADISGKVRTILTDLEVKFNSIDVAERKEPEQKVDMSLEMLDIDALNTGKYHAMVLQDPRDKKKIKGYFHLSPIYPKSQWRERNFLSSVSRGSIYNGAFRAIPNIVRAINRYTGIKAEIGPVIPLDSPELFKVPWAYISSHTFFELSDIEAANLGQYFLAGGFMLADDDWANKGVSASDMALRKMFKDALAAVGVVHGRDWDFENIPNDHLLYHCYFDFNDGPPTGHEWWDGNLTGPYNYLEGVFVDNKLLGIMTNKDYVEIWGNFAGLDQQMERTLHICINIIVFALTQEGSITHQVMQYVE